MNIETQIIPNKVRVCKTKFANETYFPVEKITMKYNDLGWPEICGKLKKDQ